MSFDNSDNNSEASASSSDEEQKNVEVSGFKLHIPRAKLEELIKEGLAIAPFLERQSIINLYRDYMENESILMNKLRIMVKERQRSENDTEGWILSGGAARAETKDHSKGNLRREEEVLRQKYLSYNFLEDKELIDRVLKKNVEPRKNRDYDIDRPRKEPKFEYQEVKPKANRGAPKYVEKKPELEASKSFNEKKKVNKPEKSPEAAPVKVGKYTEKKEIVVVKSEETVVIAEPRVQSKPVEEIKKAAQQTPKKQISEQMKKEEPKELPKKVVEVKTTPVPPVEQKPVESKPTEVSPTKAPDTKPLTSTSSIKSFDANEPISDEVMRNFGQSLKDNAYVLSFIKPNRKKQLVEYIVAPDSTAPQKVSVRVLAD